MAQSAPVSSAIVGVGGIALSIPSSTALAGKGGIALSAPTSSSQGGPGSIVIAGNYKAGLSRAGHVPTFLKSFRSVLERGASA